MSFAVHEGSFYSRRAALAFADWLLDSSPLGDAARARTIEVPAHIGLALEEVLWPTFVAARADALGVGGADPGPPLCAHGGAVDDGTDDATARSILALRLGRDRTACGAPAALKRWRCVQPAQCPVATALLDCLATADRSGGPTVEADQRGVLSCAASSGLLDGGRLGVDAKARTCALLPAPSGAPFSKLDALLDLAVEVRRWLAARAGLPVEDRPAAAAALLALSNVTGAGR